MDIHSSPFLIIVYTATSFLEAIFFSKNIADKNVMFRSERRTYTCKIRTTIVRIAMHHAHRDIFQGFMKN